MARTFLFIFAGAIIGAGVLSIIVGRMEVEEKPAQSRPRLHERLSGASRRVLIGLGVGLVVLLLTRWPVLAVAVAALVFFAPMLFGGAASERQAMQRLEGLAAWTESLRDTMAGAVGLEQAIPATTHAASAALRPHLLTLAERLRVRTPLPIALQGLADDIDDPSADLIVAALVLNARVRGPGMRQVLSSLAKSAREEVEMRRRVSASRASTRRSVQIVVGITIAFVLGLAVFNREYVAPYTTVLGQLVLVFVFMLFAVGFFWMRQLAEYELPERFLLSKADRR